MSDTPRTDAVIERCREQRCDGHLRCLHLREHAGQLERELSTLRQERRSCRDVPPGNGYCDMCAQGHYEKCRYIVAATDWQSRAEAAEAQLATLRGALAELVDALRWILPMAKGYAHEHPVGRNGLMVTHAAAVLEKHDDALKGEIAEQQQENLGSD